MLPLSEINLNQLYSFWRITKAGSFSSASRVLFRTQPALSLQVSQLEKGLGKTLLTRGRKGVALTPDGQLVASHCERIFQLTDELLASLEGGIRVLPVLRLVVGWNIPYEKIAAVARFIRGISPGISVRITTGGPDYIVSRLAGGMAHIAISNSDLSAVLGRDYRGHAVSKAPLFFMAAPKLKKAVGSFPAGMAGAPMLLRPPESPVRKDTENFFHRNRLIPVVHSELTNHELLKEMAIAGDGVAVMDPSMVAPELKSGKLVKLHHKPVGINEIVWFICPLRSSAHPLVAKVVNSMMNRRGV